MARMETSKFLCGYPRKALPLLAVNHISFAVPNPLHTACFFEGVLGFKQLTRPEHIANNVDGAWICGMGLEIHFIKRCERTLTERLAAVKAKGAIDPRNDHVSFLCTDTPGDSDFERIMHTLEQCDVEYAAREFDQHLKQLFFCDPTSGILIEVSTSPKC